MGKIGEKKKGEEGKHAEEVIVAEPGCLSRFHLFGGSSTGPHTGGGLFATTTATAARCVQGQDRADTVR